ncbi:hypothetical protein [Oceanisphaera sp. IT1-181]|uniref:hypothetical protein n=1 Tax=Oceanisphaera sp. IT1-181 TaxID=3081199 RepID=UPI0029C9E74B|nr:hypothetical protein [Oceanisphaera sp. IT1-181]
MFIQLFSRRCEHCISQPCSGLFLPEVADLEAAGVSVIQIDQPAFRELMFLCKAPQAAYLN